MAFEQYVDAEYFLDRIDHLYELLSHTTNPELYDARLETIQKLVDIVENSNSIDEVVYEVNQQYDTFCAMWLDGAEVPLIPTPWQRRAAEGLKNNNRAIWLCARRVGKALPLDTKVPTPSGFTTMGEIKIGDTLFDENGKKCTVTGVTDIQYDRDCYEITFSDGNTVIADADHQWTVSSKYQRRYNPEDPSTKTLTTEELMENLYYCEGTDNQENNWSIPLTKPVEYSEQDLPIDPYVLGVWLGDGNARGARITSADPEVIQEIERRGQPVHKGASKYGYNLSDGQHTGLVKPESLYHKLNKLNLLNNKHVPEEYIISSVEQRQELLRGLLDTDGYATKTGTCIFTNTNIHLAKAVKTIAESLGLRTTWREKQPSVSGNPKAKCKLAYKVTFKPDFKPFYISRKAERINWDAGKLYNNRTISNIEPVDSVPVKCIEVDSPNHLFLITDSYIPTHNSTTAASFILWDSIKNENRNHLIFAPTKGQLIVMEDFVKFVRSHPLFSKGYVGEGQMRKTMVEFDLTGSSVKALNIGLHENFDLKRGVGGNRFWVDEFALVSEDARKELIDPLLRESIGGQITKKLILIGTPKLTHNPNLKQEVDNAETNDNIDLVKVTCWDAMRQGIKDPEQMKEVFKSELNIPCQWVQDYGACPQFIPEWFDIPEDVNPKDYAHDGEECPSTRNDKFLMEEMAEFPEFDERYFPTSWVNATAIDERFTSMSEVNPDGITYYMAVDIGLLAHPSVVMVGHIVPRQTDGEPYLKIDYWEEIPPFDPSEAVSATSNRHIKRIKSLYKMFEPKVVFVDATRALDTTEMLCSGDNRIPRSKFYADETMENKGGIGIWWSADRKTELYSNYKRLMDQGRVKVPGPQNEPEFWQTWWNDHFKIEAEPTRDGRNLKFGETGHTVDAAVMLGMCLTKLKPKKAFFDVDISYI